MKTEVVISGMSGRFPESENISELSENLFNKVDMITDDGRRYETPDDVMPKRLGKIKHLDKFDNLFFNVHHKQSVDMDPQARILLEVTYEAIADAGYDPTELRGRNIGVFIGNSISETGQLISEDFEKFNGYALLGCVQSLFANRISHVFDFKGPSFVMDTACSSAAMALYQAFEAINRGDCEAAVVGGAHIILKPEHTLAFYKLKMVSLDGKSKTFDAACDGYVRSEAIPILFLQRADLARRNYATIVSVKTNTDGFKKEGITFPSGDMQKRLMTEVLDECELDPHTISYVEAHVTGTPMGDPVEISAITDVFCRNRNETLLIGSVKSNIGHTEPCSGICSAIKVLVAMERGLLPPNLHFNEPHPSLKDLVDQDQVKIVTESTPWNGEYALFNCFGFGGVNVSCMLRRNSIAYDNEKDDKEKPIIPQLVLHCGRTEESVKCVFDHPTVKETSAEFFALLHNLAYASQFQKPYRGYKLYTEGGELSEIKLLPQVKRPVWYVFSGMGTQWPGMAKDLMKIETCAKSIRKSAEVLKAYDLDLMEIITNGSEFDISPDSKTNDRKIIPTFVSIAAVQIALVDLLTELGIKPDGIVGHSVGELGCAFADGCLTDEQMILSSYWRGKAIEDSQESLIQGIMAAVGMTWSEAQERCPKDIYPSCHNAEDSLTISGPVESMQDFIKTLEAENIFVREVNACGYAFHCDYVLPAAEKLKVALQKVIPDPKERTSRWISSSYPEGKWNDPETKIADYTYFVNNLVSPVLFYEALCHVPKNAIVVEIGPHHLLQAILKRVIGPDAVYIGLMKKNSDNIVHLLSSIGKLYTAGLDANIGKLYPPVQFPVPRNTPMISPLIKWDHSETFKVHRWNEELMRCSSIIEIEAGPIYSPDHFLLGHCIDGRCLFPAAGYIYLAYKAFHKLNLQGKLDTLPAVFENIRFHRATLLSETATTKFMLYVSRSTGVFEISEGGAIVCTGCITSPSDTGKKSITLNAKIDKESLTLKLKDMYKEFRLRGYEYGSSFQGVLASDLEGKEGILKWNGNWIVYLDSILHISVLNINKRVMLVPIGIEKLTIDPGLHQKVAEESLKEYEGIPIKHDPLTGEYFTGGIYIKKLSAGIVRRRPDRQTPLLEEYKFLPYIEHCSLSKAELEHVEEYNIICLSVSKKILDLCEIKNNNKDDKDKNDDIDDVESKKIDDELQIDEYLKSNAYNSVLLKCLWDIRNSLRNDGMTDDIKKFIDSYIEERANDILFQTLSTEAHLRPLIDIAMENIASRKLKIVEVTEGCTCLISKINKYIAIPEMLKISFSVAHPNKGLVKEDDLPPGTDVKSWENKETLDFNDVDILILNYLNSSDEDLKSVLGKAVKCVKNEGFIILLQKTQLTASEHILSAMNKSPVPSIKEENLELMFKDLSLVVIGKRSDSLTSSLYLLRKCPTSSFKDSVIHVNTQKYDWVDELKAKMVELKQSQDVAVPERVWIVSEESQYSGVIGLVNCLRQEPGALNLRCVFIGKEAAQIPKFSPNQSFYQEQLEKNLVMNVYQKGSWGSFRHLRCKKAISEVETQHAYLDILTIGDLSSFTWIESPLKYFTPAENAVLCYVYYASLNFKDVMLTTGKIPLIGHLGMAFSKNSLMGLEFSGRTCDGRPVMGIASQAMATTLVAVPELIIDVPDEWTLEEAATVPVAYGTAYYSLIDRAKLKKGQRILIHAGSGGVGQAAIAIAIHMGCEVFTSVGSEEKKEFLKKKFPQLEERHFCNSRDTTFEQHILRETNGEGVDVVLNSLAEDKLFASVNCLAVDGCFLEIGRYDMLKNSSLGMAAFLKNIQFHGIALDNVTGKNEKDIHKMSVMKLIEQGIAEGVVKPLNTTVFNHDHAEQAFRYMASGRHTGKVLLKVRDEEEQKQTVPTSVRVKAIARTTFDPKKSYIIIGGLGGFGMELCDWMIDRGAKNIILTSRAGITTGYQELCLQRWKENNANIVISKLNASKLDEAVDLIEMSSKYGPVGGIFNLAMVLRDAFMENQTLQNYIDVCEPKVEITKNMDQLSREFCPDLEWFVCFSSRSCGRGNAAQSNYGYANSVMERICEDRVSNGLPGLAIQWGAVGDVGILHEKIGSDVVALGALPQKIRSCLSVLAEFLQQNHPVVSSLVPYEPDEDSSHTGKDLFTNLASIFGIKDISAINPESTLGELGMDSLMGVELKQILELHYNIVLSVPELRQLKVKHLKKLGEDGNLDNIEIIPENQLFDAQNFFGKIHGLTSKDLVPEETIIHMNAITDGIPVFMIHPLEGSVFMLQTLAELLPCPVYGIQCTIKSPYDSIENLAAFYWEHVKGIKSTTEFIYLVGYSFGAAIAFEMTIQAEQDSEHYPEIQNLIFLDGSHNFVTNFTHNITSLSNDAAPNVNEEIAVLYVFSKMFEQEAQLDKEEMRKLDKLEERIHYVVNKIAEKNSNLHSEDIQNVFNLFSKKMEMAFKYSPKHKLKADICLIKASETYSFAKSLTELYDLEKVCEGKIASHTVNGNHYDFIQNDSAKEVANILTEIFSF